MLIGVLSDSQTFYCEWSLILSTFQPILCLNTTQHFLFESLRMHPRACEGKNSVISLVICATNQNGKNIVVHARVQNTNLNSGIEQDVD